MNERIFELAKQVWPDPSISHANHLKFAELIIRECMDVVDTGENQVIARYQARQWLSEHFEI